ncbi:hypothetical protein tb265_22680 [Gemmatimonadetes bacterium T265]|nr:hypothetical protein tb265_22680 [Gemmatimonadetes bacterium T265]
MLIGAATGAHPTAAGAQPRGHADNRAWTRGVAAPASCRLGDAARRDTVPADWAGNSYVFASPGRSGGISSRYPAVLRVNAVAHIVAREDVERLTDGEFARGNGPPGSVQRAVAYVRFAGPRQVEIEPPRVDIGAERRYCLTLEYNGEAGDTAVPRRFNDGERWSMRLFADDGRYTTFRMDDRQPHPGHVVPAAARFYLRGRFEVLSADLFRAEGVRGGKRSRTSDALAAAVQGGDGLWVRCGGGCCSTRAQAAAFKAGGSPTSN